jgi:oligosaccharide repeat unit polymerase
MSIIFLSLFLIILFSFFVGRDLFSPAKLFGLVWCFVLMLAEFKFSALQHNWSWVSWMLMLLGPLFFLLAVFIVYVFNCTKRLPAVFQSQIDIQEAPILEKKFLIFTGTLFLLYVIGYVVNTITTGYIPMFASKPSESRTEWGSFGFGLLIFCAPVILFLVTEYIMLFKKNKSVILILIMIFFITLVSYIFLIQRYNLVMWICMSLVLIYYTRKKLLIKVLISGSVFMFVIANIINSFRFARYIEHYLYFNSKMKFSPDYAIFTEPYMYIVMGLENFARAIEKLEYHTWGYFTFKPYLSLTGMKRFINSVIGVEETPFLISGYNTFPFHWYYYYDYGILGVIVGSFMLGFITALIYWRMKYNPSLENISLYSICVFVMLMSFYLNPLTMLNFIFVVILTQLSQRYIMRDRRDKSREAQRILTE